MSEQDIAQQKQWQLTPTTIGCTLGVASTAGIVDLAAHLGPNGLLVGAIAALVAARHGEDIVNGVRDRIPQSVLDAMSERFARQQRKLNKRANPKDEQTSLQDDEDRQTLDATIDVTPNTTAYYAPDEDDDEAAPVNVVMDSSLFTFSEVLAKGFVPTVHKIFVGRTMEGKDIFVSAEDLCHVALAGKTGGGKGSLMRLLMVQLCYVGAKVLLLNPHYMRWVRAKDGANFDEDWTPFEGINPRTGKPYLEAPPIKSADPEPIAKCLRWSVETLLAKRKMEGREGGKVFAPYFIVLDEWPDVVSEVNKAADYLGKLLRQGRKYGIFVIVASQDFQVKTTGMDGGSVRKCLLTCFYTGGDTTTAKELLYSEKPSSLPESKIGKGIVLLRCTGTKNEATLAKVPFVDNAAVYRLLGPSTFRDTKQAVLVEEPEAPLPQATMPSVPAPTPVAQAAPVPQAGGLTIDQILALFAADKLSEAAMLKLIDRLPVVQDAAAGQEDEDEGDDPRAHLRLVSSDAVEDDYHSQETERLPETQRSTGRFSKSLSPELLRVYNAYEPGKSHRDIARELGDISHPTVGKIIQRLKDKGAIDPNGRKMLVS